MTVDVLTIGCLEAEAATLGAVLLGGRAAFDRLPSITPADFADPRHATVFEALLACAAASAPCDPVTVLAQLRRTGAERSFTTDRSAGVYLADLVAAAPAAVSAGWYARIVIEHAVRRRVEEAGQRFVQAAGSSSFDDLKQLVEDERRWLHVALNRVAGEGS